MGLGNLGLRNNLKQEKEDPFIGDKTKWMSVDLDEKQKKIDFRKENIKLAEDS